MRELREEEGGREWEKGSHRDRYLYWYRDEKMESNHKGKREQRSSKSQQELPVKEGSNLKSNALGAERGRERGRDAGREGGR